METRMSMKKLGLTGTAILLAGLSAAPAAASSATSWGKAGVSFEAYRADATFCLREAAATDLRGTPPARALVLASRQVEMGQAATYSPMNNGAHGVAPGSSRPPFEVGSDTALRVGQERNAAQVERRVAEAREILEARLERCLADRGYHRFRLTREQRRRLDRLPERAPERQAYLHSLASDPQILAAQGL